ncbi:hypothetical protein FF2_026299 [Malus domestica]
MRNREQSQYMLLEGLQSLMPQLSPCGTTCETLVGIFNSHLKCGRCDATGHTSETCRAHLKCDYCNWRGHTIDQCRKLKKAKDNSDKGDYQDRRGSNSQGFNSKANHVDIKPTPPATSPSSYSLTLEQYHNLLALLDKSQSKSTSNHVGTTSTMNDLSGSVLCASPLNKGRNWIFDTGATDHMVCSPSLMTTSVPVYNRQVHLPNHALADITHIGTVRLSNDLVLYNVLCVPSFKLNLISVSKITNTSSCFVIFTDKKCLLQGQRSGKMIGTGTEQRGLYYLDNVTKTRCNSVSVVTLSASQLWHQRLGHLSNKTLRAISPCIKILNFCSIDDCLICPLAKQTRAPFPLSSINTKAPFELIHVDIWGGYHVPTITGAQYFLTIVDDFTRCTWVYLMNHKSDARSYLITFIHLVETQFSTRVKVLRSDNGPEFFMTHFFSDKGILHQTSCVSTPQQNGVAERKHRHLLNVARALLFQSHLPKKFWGNAILTATYLINRTPTPLLHGKSPYEILHHKQPTYAHLRVFGCLCFSSTHHHRPTKFDARATRCIFLGYPYGTKGYRVYDLQTGKIFFSCDVIFHENVFPFSSSVAVSPVVFPYTQDIDCDDTIIHPSLPLEQDSVDQSTSVDPSSSVDQSPSPPRLKRLTHAPGYLQQYHVGINLPSRSVSSSHSALTTVVGTSYPLSDVLTYDRLSARHRAFTTSISAAIEPSSFSQAVRDPQWRLAMEEELAALLQIGHGLFNHCPLESSRLAVSGSTKSNFVPMDQLSGIKHTWLPKVIAKLKA